MRIREWSGCRARSRSWTWQILLFVFLTPLALQAQQDSKPQRGFHPAGSYALTDLETINTGNGNLMLSIPLASLPAGRGGTPGPRVDLLYNSKLWDSYLWTYSCDPDIPYCDAHTEIVSSEDGGWRYAFNYELRLDNRRDHYYDLDGAITCYSGEDFIVKMEIVFPDGSVHEFRPRGFVDDGSGYFNIKPDGYRVGGCASGVTTPMTYYSVDGTYLKLVIDHDADGIWSNNPWTLYLPDGGKVTGGNAPQRIYDRNNNWVEFHNLDVNGDLKTEIVDQLGRSLIVDYGESSQPDYVYAWGTNNEQMRWRIDWTTISVNKTYDAGECYYHCPPFPSSLNLGLMGISQISLPAQAGALTYTFSYNPTVYDPLDGPGWGELSYLRLPSGVEASYRYRNDGANLLDVDDILSNLPKQKDLTYRREYDGASTSVTETWTYSSQGGVGSNPFSIFSPDGGVTRYYHDDRTRLIYKTEYPDGRVVERLWQDNVPLGAGSGNPYVKKEFNSLKDPFGTPVKTAIKDFSYDKNGNVTSLAEYDWVDYTAVPRSLGRPTGLPAGAPLKRTTVNTYYNPTPDASWTGDHVNAYYYQSPNPDSLRLRNALESSEIRTEAGLPLSRTEMFYDNSATTGNLTQEKQWDSTKGPLTRPLGAGNSISVFHQYDSYGFGNRTLTTDGRGYQTEFVYGPINGQSYLFVTQRKEAYQTTVQRTTNFGYDFYAGRVTSQTDADNNVTTRTSYDVFGRPILVEQADGTSIERQTATEYSDTARRIITRADLNTTGDARLVRIDHYDPLGRLRLTRQLEDSLTQDAYNESAGIKVQTRYAYSSPNSFELVSNPYRAATSAAAGSEATMGWTRNKRDNGGRVVEAQTFSGASLPQPWGSNTTTTGSVTSAYDANTTTVTDQAGKARQNVVDGLGRLWTVIEDPANLAYSTVYSYDALDNLKTVQQGVQTRTFVYDSLSRLSQATNPENGQVSYSYDANGNLTWRRDARNIETSYNYDPLNRLIARSYSDSTPANTYAYGDTQGTNQKPLLLRGRLLSADAAGVSLWENLAYDEAGRVTQSRQTTATGLANPLIWAVMNYSYDRASNLTSETYPSGRTVNTAFDLAGRISSVRGNFRIYANQFSYEANAGLRSLLLGNGLYEQRRYNDRQQVRQIGLGQSLSGSTDLTSTDCNKLLLGYTYGVTSAANNGNIRQQTIAIPGMTYTQTYTYDSLNRLYDVQESENQNPTPTWSQTFTPDRYGNLTQSGDGVFYSSINYDANTNRIVSFVIPGIGTVNVDHDAAGNVKQGTTYTYDAENRVKSYESTTYYYDGDGRRVRKSSGGITTIYAYDILGQLISEYSTANPSAASTVYLTADHLGSTRLVTNGNQGVVERHDFRPFGQELLPTDSYPRRSSLDGYGFAAVNQKFTGKERDNESGLDFFGARYYWSSAGRFTSVDPGNAGADLADPQSWNGYAYARNNPLRFVDPTGLNYEDLTDAQKKLINQWADRQNQANNTQIAAQEMYNALAESQRGTTEAVLNALENTTILSADGTQTNGLQLVQSVDMIAGRVDGEGGASQFRLYVTLTEGAGNTLSGATNLHGVPGHGEEFPISRQLNGGEPSFQISMSRDLRRADIDVDYESKNPLINIFNGFKHLQPSNSDVRAGEHFDAHTRRFTRIPLRRRYDPKSR